MPDISEQWDRDGFLIVPAVVSPEQCEKLKIEALHLLKEHARPGASVYVGCAVVSKLFSDLVENPTVLDLLSQIMPDGIEFLSDKLVYKTATRSFATPWHIDASYWKNTRPKLSVWIPFDDIGEDTAALTLVPRSHKKEWSHQHAEGAKAEFEEFIRKEDIAVEDVKICEIKRGTAVIFSDRLVHGSTPAAGTRERYAIISTYHAPGNEEFDQQFKARKVLQA